MQSKRAPRSLQSAALVHAFAFERQCAIRTARWHRTKNTPDWRAFMERAAAEGGVTPPGVSASVAEDTRSNVERCRVLQEKAWASLNACIEQRERAMAMRQPGQVHAWIRSEAEAARHYRRCVVAREQAELIQGSLIPAAEVARIRTEFLAPLRELLEAMPAEMGPKVNHFDPEGAIRAMELWLSERLSPAMEALDGATPRVGPDDSTDAQAIARARVEQTDPGPIVSTGDDSSPGTGGPV